MPKKTSTLFKLKKLHRVKNTKLIHFKDELGRPIDGQLVIG
ncbi:hypothetical protein [Rickettsia australis]|uniref:Uncharacterized protein n=1 Tax=Rickettsia australis (strain Cutlack) TaxID=1105110 RepID=H8K987_RICAC|nr:hypothetical protein [Rickettsia australis]AFC70607.1 hypothetical protein MC5_00980 [Rickettsia australis str. Cutlack]